jgi:hypothetical protein
MHYKALGNVYLTIAWTPCPIIDARRIIFVRLNQCYTFLNLLELLMLNQSQLNQKQLQNLKKSSWIIEKLVSKSIYPIHYDICFYLELSVPSSTITEKKNSKYLFYLLFVQWLLNYKFQSPYLCFDSSILSIYWPWYR